MTFLKLTKDEPEEAGPTPLPFPTAAAANAPAFNRWARTDHTDERPRRHDAEIALDRAQRKLEELAGLIDEWEPLPFPRRSDDPDAPPPAA